MSFCGNSKMWLKFIKIIVFPHRSPPASDFSVLFYQNLIQNMFLCSFSMIFVKFLHLISPQVELSGGRLKWDDWMTFENELSTANSDSSSEFLFFFKEELWKPDFSRSAIWTLANLPETPGNAPYPWMLTYLCCGGPSNSSWAPRTVDFLFWARANSEELSELAL